MIMAGTSYAACWAIIAAAGRGERAGGSRPKQFAMLQGRPVLWHAAAPFARSPEIDFVRAVVRPEDKAEAEASLTGLSAETLPFGADSRALSVRAGLAGVPDEDWAVVHDGARPCLSDEALARLLAGRGRSGALLAMPVRESLKRAREGRVAETLSRQEMFLAQTPQIFRAGALRAALFADAEDEAQAMELAGCSPRIVPGCAANIKITYPEDFALAEAILAARSEAEAPL